MYRPLGDVLGGRPSCGEPWAPQPLGELRETGPMAQAVETPRLWAPFLLTQWGARGAKGPSKRPPVKASPVGRYMYSIPPKHSEDNSPRAPLGRGAVEEGAELGGAGLEG
jgi:hypothetical protein